MTERYSRQVLFKGIGQEGQARLGRSSALLVGCGALGSVLAEILVRAGVGRLTIADRDYVDESNLQRQSLFTESDCREALPKAVAAASRLRAINGAVTVVDCVEDVRAENIGSFVEGQDVLLDGTDNFETRYLMNDASLRWRIPWVYGACVGSYGLCMPVLPGETPCLRCVIEELPAPGSSPTCDTIGVIGPVVHVVAGLEAAEALKILTGRQQHLSRKLISIDVWDNRLSSIDFSRRGPASECPACAQGKFEFLEGRLESRSLALCGRNAVQVSRGESQPVDFQSISSRLKGLGEVTFNEFLLRAVLPPFEIALFRNGRAIIRGTQDLEEARRVYSKYVGA